MPPTLLLLPPLASRLSPLLSRPLFDGGGLPARSSLLSRPLDRPWSAAAEALLSLSPSVAGPLPFSLVSSTTKRNEAVKRAEGKKSKKANEKSGGRAQREAISGTDRQIAEEDRGRNAEGDATRQDGKDEGENSVVRQFGEETSAVLWKPDPSEEGESNLVRAPF